MRRRRGNPQEEIGSTQNLAQEPQRGLKQQSALLVLGRAAGLILLRLTLVAVVLVVFIDLFSAQRVFDTGDDSANYSGNVLLAPLKGREWKHWKERLLEIYFADSIIGVWEPMPLAMKLALAEAFGLKAQTFTGAATVLHAIACGLALELTLYGHRVLEELAAGRKDPSERTAVVQVWPLHAWAAVLMIGVHPLRVEPLAWASGLPYEISTVFALLAALCHVAHRSARGVEGWPCPIGPGRLASALFLLLACNAKASALGLVAALILFDLLMLWEAPIPALTDGRRCRRRATQLGAVVIDCLPLALAAGAAARPAFQASKGPDPGCMFEFRWWQRWLRASYMAVLYLVQHVWPKDLCVLHAVPVEDIALESWRFGGAAFVSALALALLAVRAFSWPRTAASVAAYLALLSPTLGIVTEHITETAADRYCHLPAMLLGVPVLSRILAHFGPRRLSSTVVLAVAFVLLLASEVAMTRHYLHFWNRPEDTIKNSATVSPKFYRTRYIYGMNLLSARKLKEAESELRASLALCPRFTNTHFGLTQALHQQGRAAEAIKAMQAGIVHEPTNHFGHFNLGMLLQQAQRLEEAVPSYQRAVQLEPNDPGNHQALAGAMQAQRRAAAAGRPQSSSRPSSKDTSPGGTAQAQGGKGGRTAPHSATAKVSPAALGSEPKTKGQSTQVSGNEASAGRGQGARPQPYLSIVVASRNDDYAGRLQERVVAHFALLYHQLLTRCFRDVELLVVEWNPPPEQPGLIDLVHEGLRLGGVGGRGEEADGESETPAAAAACGWPKGDKGPVVQHIWADPALHANLVKEGFLSGAPMAEYFAKNLGIRSAQGEFILVTNPDIVLSPDLVGFLAGRTLRQDSFYTASLRFDKEWPKKPRAPRKYLRSLMDRVLDDSRLEGTEYAKTLKHRPENEKVALDAFGKICLQGDDGKGRLPGYWDFQAGDFVIAARNRWQQAGGYPETSWTFGVDTSVLCKFFGMGLRNVALLPPCFVVHQHHRIRENPNARRVMDENRMCELCKQDPLQRLHPKQRSPELWGRHFEGSGRILVGSVLPTAERTASPRRG